MDHSKTQDFLYYIHLYFAQESRGLGDVYKRQGIRQQYIDQSVSLNLAFPAEATPKWINKVHLDAVSYTHLTLPTNREV